MEPDDSANMLERIRPLLQYYPLVATDDDEHYRCTGTPDYRLELTRHGTGLAAFVTFGAGKETVWSRTVPLANNPSDRQRQIAVAQVAYLLAHDRGSVSVDALRRKWANPRAESEFRCVMRAHEFFVTYSNPSFFETAHRCLERTYRTARMADVPAMLAALELERSFVPALGGSADARLYRSAVDAARAIDAQNSELLMAELRRSRTGDGANVADALVNLDTMNQVYPFEPHVLNQQAITRCRFTEDFVQGAANLADAIEISMGKIDSFGSIYCNMGMLKDRENLSQVSMLKYDTTPTSQLLMLQIADATGDSILAELAVANLRKQGCTTLACARKTLGMTRTGPLIERRILDAAARHLAR